MPRSQRLEPAAGFSVDPASTGASGATTLPATSAPRSVASASSVAGWRGSAVRVRCESPRPADAGSARSSVCNWPRRRSGNRGGRTYIPDRLQGVAVGPFFHPRDCSVRAAARGCVCADPTWCAKCGIAVAGSSSIPTRGASAPASPWPRKLTPPTSRCGCASAAGLPTG